jgi:hypothetical protein
LEKLVGVWHKKHAQIHTFIAKQPVRTLIRLLSVKVCASDLAREVD